MVPGLVLAVALTTDPAVVSAWPVSERDAELAATEAALRDLVAECLTGVGFFEQRKEKYGKFLASIGGGTDQDRKLMAAHARRLEESKTELSQARDRVREIQHLREKERKLRTERPKEEKR